MLKLIYGEIYRLFRKKSLYIYFSSLAAGYFLLAFIRSGGFSMNSITKDAIDLFFFLPALAGGFLFSAIYTDDLNSKNLITLVGFGISKTKIVFTKLILIILFNTFVFALAPVLHFAAYAILGWTAAASMMATVYAFTLKFLLITIAFSALSGIVVFGLQRATFAIVLYILFAFNVISGLLTVALSTFAPDFTEYLISGITDRILAGIVSGGSIGFPIFEYLVYIAIAAALSAIAFHKKEMEF